MTVSTSLRREVAERAENCCEYCRISQADKPFPFHVDHVIPEKHRGETTFENLCFSCPQCNGFKGADVGSFDENTGEFVRLFNPRRDLWGTHFLLEDAYIRAQTGIGRVTTFLLRLNNSDRLLERTLLLRLSRYPCPES